MTVETVRQAPPADFELQRQTYVLGSLLADYQTLVSPLADEFDVAAATEIPDISTYERPLVPVAGRHSHRDRGVAAGL